MSTEGYDFWTSSQSWRPPPPPPPRPQTRPPMYQGPRRAPYSMSPSRPLPLPGRMPPSRPLPLPRSKSPPWVASRGGPLPSSLPPLDLAKCERRKTLTSYVKCVASLAAARARTTYARCKQVDKNILKQKGMSRSAKKKLRNERRKQCLRAGR